jgi:hypothetical protein
VGASASQVYLHVAVVAACSTGHGAAANQLTRLHMAAAAGSWGVSDCVVAAATRALAAAKAIAAGVSYGLYMHLD